MYLGDLKYFWHVFVVSSPKMCIDLNESFDCQSYGLWVIRNILNLALVEP